MQQPSSGLTVTLSIEAECKRPTGEDMPSGRLRIGLWSISGRVDILPSWGYLKVHNHMALLFKFFFLFVFCYAFRMLNLINNE